MTREITGNNYTATCAELICAVAGSIEADRADAADADDRSTATLELFKECGWDWESDADYVRFALKSTAEEGLVEGLQKALAAVRAQYLDYLERTSDNPLVLTAVALERSKLS